jgi:ABC-2 type transport system permease protein
MTAAVTSRPAAPAAPSALQAAGLVAGREIRSRLRSRSFQVSTIILMAVVLGSIVVGSILSSNSDKTTVAAVGSVSSSISGAALAGLDGVTVRDVPDRATAEKLLRAGTVDAAVVADTKSPTGIAVLARSEAPTALLESLSARPALELLEPSATNPGLRYLVAIGFGLVFFMSALTFGTTIAQSVVEEKQTRVIEILIAAIPARALLAGKVIGTSVLAFGQIALLVATTTIGLTVTGQTALLAGLGGPVLWFAVFFLVGFVLLAALFAATGALVSRIEDVPTTTAPVTMLVMIPYFLVIFANDNPVVVGIMSYVPFAAPVGMPLRLFLGDAQWWEPPLSLAILAVTTVGVVALGARIYERSLLRMGSRVPWREALRG